MDTGMKRGSSKQLRLAYMYENELYCDCLVRVGEAGSEQNFHVNRTLLARCSDVFGKMLFEQHMQEERDAEVHIADCSSTAFRELLRCAHDLEPHITEENFVEVFQLARKYDVEELLESVRAWMAAASETPSAALRALNAAEGLSDSTVEEEVASMLAQCIETIVGNGEMLLAEGALNDCSPSTMLLLLQHNRFWVDEEYLWIALLQWGTRQDSCREALRTVAPYVRFNVMSPEFFVDRVVSEQVLDDKEVIELLCARSTRRPAQGFLDAATPRCGIIGAIWRCSRNMAEAFECTNGGCTVTRSNYPHWKRALGRWNCDDRMQRGGLDTCSNATFSVRVDHLVTQKGRYAGDILIGVASPEIMPDDHSETRNNSVPAWVYSCRDGTLIAPLSSVSMRMPPATDGDSIRFELRGPRLYIARNSEPLALAFEDVTGAVVPVVEMNLAGSRVTLC